MKRSSSGKASPSDEDISLAVGGGSMRQGSLESTTQINSPSTSIRNKKSEKWYSGLTVSILIFVAFFCNFIGTKQDMRKVEMEYQTVLNPAYWFYVNWMVVYLFELLFVLSQLFIYRLRNSPLIQKQIVVPYLVVQLSVAGVLFFLPRGWVTTAEMFNYLMLLGTAVIVAVCIIEFKRPSSFYRAKDYILVLIPFWYLLGQLLVSTTLFANIQVVSLVKNRIISEDAAGIAQLTTALVSLMILLTLALLFSCLRSVRNGVVQIPLLIGLMAISCRLQHIADYPMSSVYLSWVTDDLRHALSLSINAAILIIILAWIGAVVTRCKGHPRWYPATRKSKTGLAVTPKHKTNNLTPPSSVQIFADDKPHGSKIIGTSNSFRSVN